MSSDRRQERQAALRRRLVVEELDALLVLHPPNIRYLTGFTGSAGLLLVFAERTVLLTYFRYAEQAPQEAGGSAQVIMEPSDVWGRLRKLLDAAGRIRLGFERDHLTVRDRERLGSLESAEPVPAADPVEALRVVKDPDEVEALRAAAGLAHEALAELLPTVRVGETEQEVAARLEHALRRRGSEWHPFQTIVASGPRSALPHARSSARPLGPGEWLLLDFGAQLEGYCADLTRTVVVGGPADSRQREIYEIVRRAQRVARETIRPGMTGREADAVARDLIAAAGYEEAFGHSLGHGIGLEVHEAPRLARTAESPLPAGAAVTVAPGIYLTGWGGVRLADGVHLTSGGP